MQNERGMGRKTSNAISARFRNEEIEAINQYCDAIKIPRSVFIHDIVVAAIGKAKA